MRLEVYSDATSLPAKPEDSGQMFVQETAAGRGRTIKLDARRPGDMVPPEAWLAAGRGACQVAPAQAWRCTVPAGKYLMMGDNRDNSADSRIPHLGAAGPRRRSRL